MEIRQYWEIFKRRWWIPVVLMALVALFSAVQLRPWQQASPFYTASMRMLVGVMPATDARHRRVRPALLRLADQRIPGRRLHRGRAQRPLRAERQCTACRAEHPDSRRRHPGQRGHRQATPHHHPLVRLARRTGTRGHRAGGGDELTENALLYFRQLGTEGAGITLLDAPAIATRRRQTCAAGWSCRCACYWPS